MPLPKGRAVTARRMARGARLDADAAMSLAAGVNDDGVHRELAGAYAALLEAARHLETLAAEVLTDTDA